MDARFQLPRSHRRGEFAKYINSAGAVVTSSTLPAPAQQL